MKKMIIAAAAFFVSVLPLFAGKRLTDIEQSVIDDFWNVRMELTCLEEKQDAVKILDSYKETHKEQVEQLGEEASLLLDAIILMERYNYLYSFPGENKESRKEFSKIRSKMKDYMEDKEEDELTPYLYLFYADITSYYMAYSIKDIIFNGLSVKRNYEKAIKTDGEFSPAMVNLAQWYYYSPGIFGGSKELTVEWQLKAIEYARNNAEKFYAKSAYSQVLFEAGKIEESQKELNDCSELCPESRFIQLLKEQNAMGNSLNDYNKQRSKLLKKADDYKKKNAIEE